MMTIALMVSGNLGFKVLKHFEKTGEWVIAVIFTDKKSEAIVNWAADKQIPCFIGNPRNGKAQSFIADKAVDVLLSVNYLFIIEQDLINWPIHAAVNLHGSLLPKYRGRTPHVWAIINNESETGITAHLITEGCDEGAILAHKVIPIAPDDTGADILDKYMADYPKLVDEVLANIESGNLSPRAQDEQMATYFGQRTPSDGEINWNWQRERIRNWVRAQAAPYPGAFTWLCDKKVTIDKVKFDEYGFHQLEINGTILTDNPIRVKTPNGVLQIVSHRTTDIRVQPGMKFG
jgi:methionyl-tRNA formyltransferase